MGKAFASRASWMTALAAAAVLASAATPARGVARCPRQLPDVPGMTCQSVRVPVDRSGAVPGEIALQVTRLPARDGPATGAVVGLSGGPGEAATPELASFANEMEPALATHDLIVFDQRGTGFSGALACRSLDRPTPGSGLSRVAACANELGPRGAFYRSIDSVDDLEAVRQAAGVDRLTLYGTSYGTKVALMYAARYPEHVERLVLDSPVTEDGVDPFQRSTMQAVPRILDGLCGPQCRREVSPDPTADLRSVVGRIERGPVSGSVVEASGRRHRVPLLRTGILGELTAGDFDPDFRLLTPGALRAATRGDTAPLLRLTTGTDNEIFDDPTFSFALNLATTCEDSRFPWDPAATGTDRAGQALTALTALPDAAFGPFDRATALQQMGFCWAWPDVPAPPPSLGPLPDVPVLVVSGDEDLRTPTEDAERVATAFPRATLLRVPGAGHSVISSRVPCAKRAVRAFFADQPTTACPPARALPIPAVPPLSLSEVRPVRGLSGRVGETAAALGLTVGDADTAVIIGIETGRVTVDRRRHLLRVPGLRGGTVTQHVESFNRKELAYTLRYADDQFVPGVRLDGDVHVRATVRGDEIGAIHARGFLHIGGHGAASGTLRLAGTRLLVGRLGGRRVRIRSNLLTASQLKTSVPSPPAPGQVALRVDPQCCG